MSVLFDLTAYKPNLPPIYIGGDSMQGRISSLARSQMCNPLSYQSANKAASPIKYQNVYKGQP